VNAQEAIVVAARRTPNGRAGGRLAHLTVDGLAAPVLAALLADAGVAAGDIDEVILGNAAGPGGNPARLSLLAAGFPVSVPGVTVDRQCGSGLEAIHLGARLIRSGAAEIVIAGGVESVSTAPWRVERPGRPGSLPRFYARARFSPDSVGDPEMGEAAEAVARHCAIDRARQDAFALASHRKAVAAEDAGRFAAEIVAMADGRGGAVLSDEGPRRDTSLERLAALAPAFVAGGTVTAGNSCALNDGAAAVLMVSGGRFRGGGWPAGLRFVDGLAAGCDPNLLGLGPVPATRRLLARLGLCIDDLDLVEFNEAFAAQVLACLDALAIPEHRVSIAGGALALGHPFGASGAVLVVRLFTEMVRRRTAAASPRRGLAVLGVGGGMGVASIWEAVSAEGLETAAPP
jgi:acetyl-CoA C-acetyltransferase